MRRFCLVSQHPVTPELERLDHVTHIILAFMGSSMFNEPGRTEWPLLPGFADVSQIRARFAPGTKIMVAIGGWGDAFGFSAAALDEQSRKEFADNVARMVAMTGVDGTFPCHNPCSYVFFANPLRQVLTLTGNILGKLHGGTMTGRH
jgi:hypothetical protein